MPSIKDLIEAISPRKSRPQMFPGASINFDALPQPKFEPEYSWAGPENKRADAITVGKTREVKSTPTFQMEQSGARDIVGPYPVKQHPNLAPIDPALIEMLDKKEKKLTPEELLEIMGSGVLKGAQTSNGVVLKARRPGEY